MKKFGLIAFAVIAVALAAPVILIATLPTARVTVHAMRPTGKIITVRTDHGENMGLLQRAHLAHERDDKLIREHQHTLGRGCTLIPPSCSGPPPILDSPSEFLESGAAHLN